MLRHLTSSSADQQLGESPLGDFAPQTEFWREVYNRRSQRTFPAGWCISAAMHVGLLVIMSVAFLPADLGDACTLLLDMSAEPEETPLETITMLVPENTDEETDSLPFQMTQVSVATEQEAITPVDQGIEEPPSDPGMLADLSELPLTRKVSNIEELQQHSDELWQKTSPAKRGDAGGKKGPKAEYFGTVAYGDRFVYVLDMSGSMDYGVGTTRFDRASAELIRSIEHLREDQWFYVVLFSNRTKRMFNDRSPIPQWAPATPANKALLKGWLLNIHPGGDTDPRQAMRLALGMRPSAVFMLSDGEFDCQTQGNQSGVVRGNPSIYDMVTRNNPAASPIHSVAYEEKGSCKNMEVLATKTGGKYKYIPPPPVPGESKKTVTPVKPKQLDPEERAGNLFQLAEAMETAGKDDKALQRYRDLAKQFPNTMAGQAAQQRLEGTESGETEEPDVPSHVTLGNWPSSL